jgi:hypothetical protein
MITFRRQMTCSNVRPSLRSALVRDDEFTRSLETAASEDALLTLAQRYAYVVPASSVLDLLAELGPLVEMGAGTGYWASKLRSAGVDVIAFDQAPVDAERTNRYHPSARPWADVSQGDQTILTRHADRGLFLCWPPLFSSLGDCLTYYSGDTVAYIGDGGYRTARLDHLQETFTKVATASVRALDPDPRMRPQLTIWKRTPRSGPQRSPRPRLVAGEEEARTGQDVVDHLAERPGGVDGNHSRRAEPGLISGQKAT